MGYRNVLELAIEREEGERVTLTGAGIRLTGVRKQPLSGGRACVAFRPEEILAGEGAGGLNTLAGRVDNVEYCGRDSLVDFVAPDGSRLHVRTAATIVLGDDARFHLPVERALVYPSG
jgi:hypothetical protein